MTDPGDGRGTPRPADDDLDLEALEALATADGDDGPAPPALPAGGREALLATLRARRAERRTVAPVVLITECLQAEFFGTVADDGYVPRQYVGDAHRRRVLGADPGRGPLKRFLDRFLGGAAADARARHRAVHVRDFHPRDAEGLDAHYAQYGAHCLEGTPGVDFLPFVAPLVAWDRARIAELDDLMPKEALPGLLDDVCEGFDLREVRVALVGAFTDLNVAYHAHLARSRAGARVAVCAQLTAPGPQGDQDRALRLVARDGVDILPTVDALCRWLEV